eukprot:6179106-Pleurochrysis_carterae.AAC.4
MAQTCAPLRVTGTPSVATLHAMFSPSTRAATVLSMHRHEALPCVKFMGVGWTARRREREASESARAHAREKGRGVRVKIAGEERGMQRKRERKRTESCRHTLDYWACALIEIESAKCAEASMSACCALTGECYAPMHVNTHAQFTFGDLA